MKLLWLSHFVPHPPRGGSRQRSFNLLREASKFFEIELVAFNMPGKSEDELARARSDFSRFCSSVEIWELPFPWKGGRWWTELVLAGPFYEAPFSCRAFWSRPIASRLATILRESEPDLIHVDSIDLGMYTQVMTGAPKLLHHHDCESAKVERRAENARHPVKKLYLRSQARKLRAWESRVCAQYQVNAVVSEEDGRRLRSADPRIHVHLVENGTDLDYFHPATEPPEDGVLVFAGSLSYYPNLSGLLFFLDGVWPRIVAANPGVRFTITGQRPPEWLKRRVRDDARIDLIADPEDIRPWIWRASTVVCPILDGGGTRVKLLDAFALGKAVVSTSIGCEGIPVTHGEHILVADSPSEFAREVLRVLENKALRDRLSTAARAFVDPRSGWPRIGKDLLDAYRCAMGERCEPGLPEASQRATGRSGRPVG